MLDWVALACLLGALAVLFALSAIDLRTRLLPNELVAGFATLGLVFHLTTLGRFLPPEQIAIGGLSGFALLYMTRMIANRLYGADALGLGDVKLMGAAGLWLGLNGIMLALTAGALAGMMHGMGVALHQSIRDKTKFDLSRLQIPAGPGFAIGIVATGIFQFRHFSVSF